MLRRVAFVLVVCSCVGIAFGAATKIRWFDNVAEPNPEADGMAILNYVQGQDNIMAQIILSDLLPNTPYVITLRDPDTWHLEGTDAVVDNGFFPISAGTSGELVSNNQGHLTFHSETVPGSGDFSGSDVLVFLLSDWQSVFRPWPAPPPTFPTGIPVRLVGYNPSTP